MDTIKKDLPQLTAGLDPLDTSADCKLQQERLDCFWIEMQKYIRGKNTIENVLLSFDRLDYLDKLQCYYSVKKKSCIDIKELLKNNINQHFFVMLDSLNDEKISVTLKQVSPKIYEVQCRTELLYIDYILFEKEIAKVNIQKGDILSLEYVEYIKRKVSRLRERIKQCENILKRINHIAALPYVKRIVPYSHWASEQYSFHTLYFVVEFEDNIHNKHIKEIIGKTRIISTQLSESLIREKYEQYKKDMLANLEHEILKAALSKNQLYQSIISKLTDICKQNNHLNIRISNDYRNITLLNGQTLIHEYEYSTQEEFGRFEMNVKDIFMEHILKQKEQYARIVECVLLVNQCKNRMWKITHFDGNFITLYLVDPNSDKELKCIHISLCKSCDIKKDIFENMKYLLQYVENYNGIRFVENI